MILGKSPLAAPPRRIEERVDTAVTIGFRSSGRLIVMQATPCMCELREYGLAGRLKVLSTFSGGRTVACEETEGRLVFWIDGDCVFSMPAGKDAWSLYRA